MWCGFSVPGSHRSALSNLALCNCGFASEMVAKRLLSILTKNFDMSHGITGRMKEN